MNRYLITLGRSHYDNGTYPTLDIALEQKTIAEVFTKYFGYEHLESLSTDDMKSSHLEAVSEWFLEEDQDELHARNADDMVVIYYTGHGDLKGDELRLVTQKCKPETLLTKGIKAADLVNGWLESPIRHVWLILDVCHSGKVGADIDAFQKHLEHDLPANPKNGRGWHIVTSCRGDQSAGVFVLAEALRGIITTLEDRDFFRHKEQPQEPPVMLQMDTLMIYLSDGMAETGQTCQHFKGGDPGGVFMPYKPWRAAQSGPDAKPTDPEAQKENLASLIQLLDQLDWPPPMFVRLLPATRQGLASRKSFSSTTELVRWVCGTQVEASRICPLVVLALRAAAEQNTEEDLEPDWIVEMARWRNADLKKCRDLARQELEKFRTHAIECRSRIKMIGEPILSPAGDYSHSVNFRVLHDFEDDDGAMLFPLAQWDGVKPADLAEDEYGAKLGSFASQYCLQDCKEEPLVQITLPLHLIHEPVESIPIPDGLGKIHLGAIYPVVLTVWERDSGKNFAPSRKRRHTKRAGLPDDHETEPLCIHLDAKTDLHGDDVIIVTACGPDRDRFYEVVNAGLPIILWTRKSPELPFTQVPWLGWFKRLANERRKSPDLDAALIWDDRYSGVRMPPAALRSPAAAA